METFKTCDWSAKNSITDFNQSQSVFKLCSAQLDHCAELRQARQNAAGSEESLVSQLKVH